MNIIPSTFNERQTSHALLGSSSPNPRARINVSCIILSRGNCQYRARVIENVLSKGFLQVICVERNSPSCMADSLSRTFPGVCFIIAQEESITQGELLNLGIAQAVSDHVLVLQEDMCTEGPIFSQNLAGVMANEGKFCWCPRLISPVIKNVPVHFVPAVRKSLFSVESLFSASEGDATLYAADLAGFYDRKKYIRLGGMDWTITSEYWQKVDLFFRAWLWGEETLVSSAFVLSYDGDIAEENRNADFSYLRFYLKNLLPVYNYDHAYIPGSSFLAFKASSSCSFSDAISLFREARRWTNANKYCFKQDAKTLIENWTNK